MLFPQSLRATPKLHTPHVLNTLLHTPPTCSTRFSFRSLHNNQGSVATRTWFHTHLIGPLQSQILPSTFLRSLLQNRSCIYCVKQRSPGTRNSNPGRWSSQAYHSYCTSVRTSLMHTSQRSCNPHQDTFWGLSTYLSTDVCLDP